MSSNHKSKEKPIVVVGSIAMDSVKTSFGSVEEALGGSATYFTIAARLFTPVRVVGVIGDDFPKEYMKILKGKRTDLAGLVEVQGKTFRWKGSYANPNEAITHDTQLNVFESFNPLLPEQYRETPYIFLANIHPNLQQNVLSQVNGYSFVGCDTMNHWIATHKTELVQLYKKVKIAFLNEREAELLSGEKNLIKAAKKIHSFGLKWLIIKKGEHGVLAYDGEDFILMPAYPVERVVDPTGAGDCFAGGFMGYMASQGKLDRLTVLDAMRYGTIVASFAVEDFSIRAIARTTRPKIEKRYERFLEMTGV